VPQEEQEYDVIVVGGGPPGENAAARARRGGLSAVLVEHELVGGECSYWACMPSKALLRPVQLLAAARRLPGVAEAVTGELDARAVFARRDRFVGKDPDKPFGHDDSGQVSWLESTGIDLVRGHGLLAGEKRVEVVAPDGGHRTLSARHAVVLATGTGATVPPLPGLREAHAWTSREATNAAEAPRRLVVLGGGVVGCEIAQAMRALGSAEVTVVDSAPRLLPKQEPVAAELLAAAFREAGIDIVTGVSAKEVRRPRPGGSVTLVLEDGREFAGDELLVAVGRTPSTADLGLETVGLEPGRYVEVDDTMHALGGWLYACGDITGRNLLTHMGKYQARVAGDVIAARAAGRPDDRPGMRAVADHDWAPQVVFTDPQVGSAGLIEEQARDRGLPVRVIDYELGKVAGASLLADGYSGHARMVVDTQRGVVVGATFVGADIAELVHSATVAIVGEVPLDRLWHAVPSYPTVSEVWLRLLEAYGL
jgi:pyruvate/2-oxoglutarate dehydrogenase complex dihydrolipoamide dehydrogenase (E3) component